MLWGEGWGRGWLVFKMAASLSPTAVAVRPPYAPSSLGGWVTRLPRWVLTLVGVRGFFPGRPTVAARWERC